MTMIYQFYSPMLFILIKPYQIYLNWQRCVFKIKKWILKPHLLCDILSNSKAFHCVLFPDCWPSHQWGDLLRLPRLSLNINIPTPSLVTSIKGMGVSMLNLWLRSFLWRSLRRERARDSLMEPHQSPRLCTFSKHLLLLLLLALLLLQSDRTGSEEDA